MPLARLQASRTLRVLSLLPQPQCLDVSMSECLIDFSEQNAQKTPYTSVF
jgi:hypothetical protein